ncbi:PLP-dependent cysteine synthase family protein [Capnocytophaga sp. ARDL2]|uniref:PLP-dependent cysteine synthase family protein n=1 Tax=Capnocytophaga sp. ARDL2 TaxID=3238809 RepID=UPI003557FFAA
MKEKIEASESILEFIGNTPLVRLNKVVEGFKGLFYAKIEAFNPGHSAKDRIALHIIETAEKKGILKPGSVIVETTSGNTGFSLAMIAMIKGYKCILAVSDKSSIDKIDMLRAMGAKVYLCPAKVSAEDPRSYYNVAKKIHEDTPNSVYINQYFNELNVEAHYLTTGKEIWEQTKGTLTHFIACSGTGGTLSGVAKYLKEKNPEIQVIGIDAYGSAIQKYHETGEFDENEIYSYRIEGLGKNLIPTTTKFEYIDRYVKVNDENSALSARELALKEGLFMGYTSGSVIQALKQLNEENIFDKNSRVVVILPDHGSRYLSKIYSDQWMNDQGFVVEKLDNELIVVE